MRVFKQYNKLLAVFVIIIVLLTVNIIRIETDPAYKLLKPVINSSERNTNIISYNGYNDHDLEKGMYTYHFSINEKSEQDIGDEIKLLYDFKKDRNEYKFHPFFWQVGGKYTYPQDKDKIYYHHRRGFEDCFEHPQNIPFRSCL